MANRALDNKCPACGAPILYKPNLKKWKCDYCKSEFTLEEMKKYNNASSEKNNKKEEKINVKDTTKSTSKDKIKKVYLSNKFKDNEIITLIKKKNINPILLDMRDLDKMCKGLHQGIILEVEDVKTYSLEDIIPNIDKEYPLVVLLDHIEDPHNFGAIIRSCEAFGVDAIIIPNDRSVDITGTVVKASVGTIEKVKIIKVTNLNNTIKKLKDYGYWVVGTDMEGTVYTDIDYKMKTALIIGNEGKGISRLVSENCDYLAKIPMSGTVNSLNASVACGIFLAEINRSRGV